MINNIQRNSFGSAKAPISATELKRLCSSNSETPNYAIKAFKQQADTDTVSLATRGEKLSALAEKYPGLAKKLETQPDTAVPSVGRVTATIKRIKDLSLKA